MVRAAVRAVDGLAHGRRHVGHDADQWNTRSEVLGDLVEGAPGREGHDAHIGASNHDGGDLLDDRSLVLGLDSQDDDVNLAGQGHVRGGGGGAQLVGQIAGLGGRAVEKTRVAGSTPDATAPRAMA